MAASSGTFYGQRMIAGDIYPVAGNGTAGFTGDGNVLIADSGNQRTRLVTG